MTVPAAGAATPGTTSSFAARVLRRLLAALARGPRLTRQSLVLLCIGGTLYGVSRTTGAGWLVVLLAGMGATLVVGAVLPLVAVRGVGVALRPPTDATAGQAVRVELTVTGRARDLRIEIANVAAPVVSDAPATGVVEAVLPRRGVWRWLVVDVAASGPLGLFEARRRLVVHLERPLEVGPQPMAVDLTLPPVAGEADEVDDGCRGDGNAPELVRGARAYVVGDPLRLVHWPASARAGSLMVRELEAPGRSPLTITVDLRGDDEEAELAAGRAAGLALAALRAGVPVTLATAEAEGQVLAPVADAVSVGRRLARAVPGPPPMPPPGRGAAIVRVGPR
jgi:uncharacterized protein (DUF58 family)